MSLIILLAPQYLSAQIRIYPDSVLIVRDDRNSVGFVFPYEVAVEYRTLRAELYPEATRQIFDLRNLQAQQDSLIGNLRQQVTRYEMIDRNSRIAIDSLRTSLTACDATLAKLDRKVRFYKAATLVSAPVAIVAILIAALK